MPSIYETILLAGATAVVGWLLWRVSRLGKAPQRD